MSVEMHAWRVEKSSVDKGTGTSYGFPEISRLDGKLSGAAKMFDSDRRQEFLENAESYLADGLAIAQFHGTVPRENPVDLRG